MKRNYTKYKAPQFAADPFFLQWRTVGDKRSSRYWEAFVREHPEKEEEIRKAIHITGTIRMNDYGLCPMEKEQLLNRILDSGKRVRQNRRRRLIAYSVAAGMALLVASTLLLPSGESGRSPKDQSQNLLSLATENIRLITAGQETFELNNNTAIVYQPEGSVEISDGDRNKVLQEQIPLSPGMNTLIVPPGKRTSLTLPDHTRIWLNAGSKVEFPARFTGQEREIYAEGEVYLEVVKDPERPFTVRTPFFQVRVLGTKFNISAYKNEPEHAVVLAEGAVEVELGNHATYRLSPNHKLAINGEEAENTEVQPYEYICWKDGLLQFSQETLTTLLGRISRYYGVTIDYTPGEDERINGKLVLFEDVRTVLDNIAVIYPITYTVHDRRIQIIRNL